MYICVYVRVYAYVIIPRHSRHPPSFYSFLPSFLADTLLLPLNCSVAILKPHGSPTVSPSPGADVSRLPSIWNPQAMLFLVFLPCNITSFTLATSPFFLLVFSSPTPCPPLYRYISILQVHDGFPVFFTQLPVISSFVSVTSVTITSSAFSPPPFFLADPLTSPLPLYLHTVTITSSPFFLLPSSLLALFPCNGTENLRQSSQILHLILFVCCPPHGIYKLLIRVLYPHVSILLSLSPFFLNPSPFLLGDLFPLYRLVPILRIHIAFFLFRIRFCFDPFLND